METKECYRCNIDKPLSEYYVTKGKARGYCKECFKYKVIRPEVINSEGEIWNPLVSYEGLYEVSNFGRVKSLKRQVGTIMFPSVLLVILDGSHGYSHVSLSKEGCRKRVMVHRLVAMAFIPNPENKPHVNHLDSNRKNNHVDNLEWCNQKENMQHALKHGNFSHEHRQKKISQYDLNGNFIRDYDSIKEATLKYNLTRGQINRRIKFEGENQIVAGFIWKYADKALQKRYDSLKNRKP